MKFILKILVGLVVIPAAVAGVLYHLDRSGFFNVTRVNIVAVSDEQKAFVAPLMADLEKRLAHYKNVSLWELPLPQVSQEIAQENWIENFSIKRSWPNAVTVEIKPYQVKMIYRSRGGTLTPVTQDGEFLDVVDSRQAPDVALLEGEVFLKKTELRKKAVQVLEELPTEGSFSRKTISEVRYDAKEGFWMTLIKNGVKVKIGEDKVGLKAARVSQVVDYLDSHQFDARVIDANLSKKVLVRLRKDP